MTCVDETLSALKASTDSAELLSAPLAVAAVDFVALDAIDFRITAVATQTLEEKENDL